MTTREVSPTGLTAKTAIEWPDRERLKRGLPPGRKEVEHLCEQRATLANEHLKSAGQTASIDHRSLADQGLERSPTKHLGPVVAERLRRGKDSYVAERIRQERGLDAQARISEAAECGRVEREGTRTDSAASARASHPSSHPMSSTEPGERPRTASTMARSVTSLRLRISPRRTAEVHGNAFLCHDSSILVSLNRLIQVG